MKILVCEDNPMTLRTIEYTLTREGHEVMEAEDGGQAIRMLHEEGIDLLITDINMPYTKGLELVRYVNKNLDARIPVIVISIINLEETKQHAMELGAFGYLTKPFDPKSLLRLVQSVAANR
ncbi:MAG TPA: response regulator [Bacteroides sp.]|nr:response regulator [Bacteroides sp.]